jgi:hypothetical protein
MSETAFIITIDTEGDNLWSKPCAITTRNAEYLPRFQGLCERHDFKPVYLVNYEMARSEYFVGFARDVVARGAGEVGMHLHAWNSPPLVPLTDDDFRHQPYLTEFPERVMREKIKRMTHLLEDKFERRMVSHRGGRWAFDRRYASLLLEAGYRVDCSVTPGIDWSRSRGAPAGTGGPDYREFPDRAYFLDPADIAQPTCGDLLEVPVTIRVGDLYRLVPWAYQIPVLRRAARMISPPPAWLNPAESGLPEMRRAVQEARREGAGHVQFMLHSSELMPGGSPTFQTRDDIERLYDVLERLFSELRRWCRSMTLTEFQGTLQ